MYEWQQIPPELIWRYLCIIQKYGANYTAPNAFGFGPYSLSSSLSCTRNTINTIWPIIGIRFSNCHQPLLPVSWRRLAEILILGTSTAKENSVLIKGIPRKVLAIVITIEIKMLNNTNIQYCLRRALPEKSAKFLNPSIKYSMVFPFPIKIMFPSHPVSYRSKVYSIVFLSHNLAPHTLQLEDYHRLLSSTQALKELFCRRLAPNTPPS